MYRIPLWSPTLQDSKPVGTLQAKQVLVLDEYELIAGKLSALLARQTSRDLFDAHELLTKRTLDNERLRQGFVAYGGMNRKDWRTVDINDLDNAAKDIESYLIPLLRKAVLPEPFDPAAWATTLLAECKAALGLVLPLTANELTFLNRLLDEGEIEPEHITQDTALADRLRTHPDLAWKALNVKKHTGRL